MSETTVALATIQTINRVSPIEDADNLVTVSFMTIDRQCVMKKGEVAPGRRVIYFEPGSVLPHMKLYGFLAKANYRVKSARFRGQVSDGLALPLELYLHNMPELEEKNDGFDVTDALQVTRYDSQVSNTAQKVARKKQDISKQIHASASSMLVSALALVVLLCLIGFAVVCVAVTEPLVRKALLPLLFVGIPLSLGLLRSFARTFGQHMQERRRLRQRMDSFRR
jgi:hypothetical protein